MVQGGWEECVAIGPWGGPTGKSFDYRPQGIITEIEIKHTGYKGTINSVKVKTKTDDGVVSTSDNFGSCIGNTTRISFSTGEHITGIEIMAGEYSHVKLVSSLCIFTNKSTYGPFGATAGNRISIPVTGQVVGFFGLSKTYLNAIGIYVVPTDKSTKHIQEIKVPNNVISVGPWGSSEGTSWSYRPAGLLSKITITHGGCIDSLHFEGKAKDGTVTSSKQYGGTSSAKFGGPGGHTTNEIPIGSGEYITGIDMMVGEYDGHKVINQLSVHTNLKPYGPFGTATGSKISIPIKEGGVVGFFGSCGTYLNAIGIYVNKNPFQEDKDDNTIVVPAGPSEIGTSGSTGVGPGETGTGGSTSVGQGDIGTGGSTGVGPGETGTGGSNGVGPGEIGTGGSTGKGDDCFPSAINKIFLNINISVKLNS